MKKSQIFLGGSAFLLAISGALATKASHKNVLHLVGYTVLGACHRIGNALLTTVKHNGANTALTSAGNKTVYTVTGAANNTVCGKKLYTIVVN